MALTVTNNKNGNGFPSLLEDMLKPDWFFPTSPDFFKRFANKDFLVIPEANVIENKNGFQIDLAAPGLERNDFQIEVDGNVLSISCEKDEEHLSEEENFRKKEFSYHSFRRSFTLPENLEIDKIDAKYDKGVLHLTLPKNAKAKSQRVTRIKVR